MVFLFYIPFYVFALLQQFPLFGGPDSGSHGGHPLPLPTTVRCYTRLAVLSREEVIIFSPR